MAPIKPTEAQGSWSMCPTAEDPQLQSEPPEPPPARREEPRPVRWDQMMRRKPPSVDEAMHAGLLKCWVWAPQRQGLPQVEMWTMRGKCYTLPEPEAEAFAEGLLIGAQS